MEIKLSTIATTNSEAKFFSEERKFDDARRHKYNLSLINFLNYLRVIGINDGGNNRK